MVTCKNCNSTNVKVNDLNFAELHREGQPVSKHEYSKKSFFCHDCENQWKNTPEVEKDYLDYLDLCNKTEMAAGEMGPNGKYEIEPRLIDDQDISHRKVLAKKILKNYKHLLSIPADKWHDIELDVSLD